MSTQRRQKTDEMDAAATQETTPSSGQRSEGARGTQVATGQSSSPERAGTTERSGAAERWRSGRAQTRPRFFPGIPTPLELIQNVSQELDMLVQSIGPAAAGASPLRGNDGGLTNLTSWMPQIEVTRNQNEMTVRADLPGLKADDVQVTVADGVLTISGERKQEKRTENDGVVRSEVTYGVFQRAIPLPESADEDRVEATFRDGVLEVTIPLAEGKRGRRIDVRS